MQYIDERFKEAKPEDTVKRIQGILNDLGIEVIESWTDSGLENCYSLSLSAKGGIPSSNGKGVTKEFARASAYGEFIERLQGGLHFYKFQSINRVNEMNLQAYAPDAKYMTVDELVENGEWMDYIINEYKLPNVTRRTIAQHCKAYACSDDGKILTIPFYSLFEKKYVYLPIDFVDQVYATNGCCVGNTRDEAWVHALSEILERHANLKIFTSGSSAPKFSEEVIEKYPIVSHILKQVRAKGEFDIDVFDYSLGSGFPVVSTRIINKKEHSYKVNVAADPVFEIALQRTLTELFQGKNIDTFTSKHDGTILNKFSDFPPVSNVVNQLETGNGLYTADFFANEITCNEVADNFADNSNKSNHQLLEFILEIYKKENRQVYVRNFSYLGFPCYRFVVPGFSEALALRLKEIVPECLFADTAARVLKNPIATQNEDLQLMLAHTNMIKTIHGRYNRFNRISGVPLSVKHNVFLSSLTRAYASYRLKRYDDTIDYVKNAIMACRDVEVSEYLTCFNRYIELKKMGVSEDKIKVIIDKFFVKRIADKLYENLCDSKTPLDEFLLKCDYQNCENCKYREDCCYENIKRINMTVGSVYKNFVNGQDESEFTI
ncbi:MAG: YcaO-like family protein [Clostridia bacterium]|nr:YcaO-like family protein [Clostridia bacterium]